MKQKGSYFSIGIIVCAICLTSFFIAYLSVPPKEEEKKEEEKEEVNQMKIPQFTAVADTNDDLEDLNAFDNIGHYDGKIWWCESNNLDADTCQLIFKSTDEGLEGSTTTEYTHNVNSIGAANSMSATSVSIYINNDLIVGIISYKYYSTVTSAWQIGLKAAYSNNGGSS